GRRNDSGLPHRSAELVLEAPRLLHQLVRAGDERAERTAEPFRETERDRVELPGDHSRRNGARDRRVQDARAVEMNRELELTARGDQRPDLLERPDPATGGVVRVLDRDNPGPRRVRVVPPAKHPLHLVRPETTSPAPERTGHHAGLDW